MFFFFPILSEYVTFLSLPYNATLVHIINQRPLFTHLGELNEKERREYRQGSNKLVKTSNTGRKVLDDALFVGCSPVGSGSSHAL